MLNDDQYLGTYVAETESAKVGLSLYDRRYIQHVNVVSCFWDLIPIKTASDRTKAVSLLTIAAVLIYFGLFAILYYLWSFQIKLTTCIPVLIILIYSFFVLFMASKVVMPDIVNGTRVVHLFGEFTSCKLENQEKARALQKDLADVLLNYINRKCRKEGFDSSMLHLWSGKSLFEHRMKTGRPDPWAIFSWNIPDNRPGVVMTEGCFIVCRHHTLESLAECICWLAKRDICLH